MVALPILRMFFRPTVEYLDAPREEKLMLQEKIATGRRVWPLDTQ
jgi:hypothetical protein